MKLLDFAQSRLDSLSIPVRFTKDDLDRIGGSFEEHGEGKATLNLPDKGLDKTKLSDDETVALIGMAESIKKAFHYRTDFHRDAAKFRELAGIALMNGPKDILAAEKAGWFTEIVTHEWFRKRADLNQLGVDATMSAIMVWVSARLRGISHTSNWFVPTEPLLFQMLATDLKGVVVGDLKLPVGSFYIGLPPGVFFLHRGTSGWHSIRYLIVTEGEVTEQTVDAHARVGLGPPVMGKRLLVEMYGAVNENSKSPFDDVWAFHSYKIGNPMADLESAITESLCDPEEERTHLRGRIGNREIDGIEVRREILRFLMNFCIYLGSADARVDHIHKDAIDRLTGGKKVKNLRQNIQDKIRSMNNDRTFQVGSNVPVIPEIEDYVLGKGTGTGNKLTYRTVVRGHWRDQAHGPGRALRRQKWIAPHVRGADLPGPVVGHTYEVK